MRRQRLGQRRRGAAPRDLLGIGYGSDGVGSEGAAKEVNAGRGAYPLAPLSLLLYCRCHDMYQPKRLNVSSKPLAPLHSAATLPLHQLRSSVRVVTGRVNRKDPSANFWSQQSASASVLMAGWLQATADIPCVLRAGYEGRHWRLQPDRVRRCGRCQRCGASRGDKTERRQAADDERARRGFQGDWPGQQVRIHIPILALTVLSIICHWCASEGGHLQSAN